MAITIKDIARLTGVSVSSVSKIINGKDSSISEETRARVLKVVKEYNYVPYSFVENNGRSYLLGVILSGTHFSHSIAANLIDKAEGSGYHIVVCYHNEDRHKEEAHLSALTNMHVDALVWEQSESIQSNSFSPQALSKIPTILISNEEGTYSIPMLISELTRTAIDILIEKSHEKLACVVQDNSFGSAVSTWFERSLYEKQIPAKNGKVIRFTKEFSLKNALFFDCTAIICASASIAAEIQRQAQILNISIPAELSLVVLADKDESRLLPSLSIIDTDLDRYSSQLLQSLIAMAENTAQPESGKLCEPKLRSSVSIASPTAPNSTSILVIGAMNTDIYVSVTDFPKPGYAVYADPQRVLPGGKGINQAMAAKKMGARVRLLGKIGSDDNGKLIYSTVESSLDQTHGILIDPDRSTGAAYVLMRGGQDGDSSVIMHTGANEALTEDDIRDNEDLFSGIQFCLLQTEMNSEKLLTAARIAKKHGCQVVLKPVDDPILSPELLRLVDYILPTEEILWKITESNGGTLEQRASWLLNAGIKNVIVTRAEQGCYVLTASDEFYVNALNIKAIDVIGASDEFIGTMVTFLGEGMDLRDSVIRASYAAGHSVTGLGVVPSLIDRTKLEEMLEDPVLNIFISNQQPDSEKDRQKSRHGGNR